jgi:hypothetical protein
MFLSRHLAIALHRVAAEHGALLLQGPRGAGKTTLARTEFPAHAYFDFADPALRARASEDPHAFLSRLRTDSILDEIHRAPAVLAALSNQSTLHRQLIAISAVQLPNQLPTLTLMPPTIAETERRPASPLALIGRFPVSLRLASHRTPFVSRATTSPHQDLAYLLDLRQRDAFERCLQSLAQRNGQLLNQLDLARELNVSHRTIVRWLHLLAQCFAILRIPALPETFGRRCLRRERVFVPNAASVGWPAAVADLYATAGHEQAAVRFFHWHDSNGFHVPLVLEWDDGTRVPLGEDARSIERWMSLAHTTFGATCRFTKSTYSWTLPPHR